uniref:Pyridine nucleotide-disulfide oxidoreductase domain-containing protein 1 n=1 Tax=Meloidogyne enterolobii TaxID=390850 RepID=A0A6V7TMK1_MELEN|nr:unnamed protein product [Meloidogyne enterolobii]
MNFLSADYVVVGGGVCGVCIVDELNELLNSEEVPGTSNHSIIFVSGLGGYIKRAVNIKKVGQISTSFDIKSLNSNIFKESKRITCLNDEVNKWIPTEKRLILKSGKIISYKKLAIATGASPKKTIQSNPLIIRLRDTQTINDLKEALSNSRRVLIFGNGGIASELAFKLKNIEVIWVFRHSHISATYFDMAAAKFFEPKLNEKEENKEVNSEIIYDKITLSNENNEQEKDSSSYSGSALGPHWIAKLALKHSNKDSRKLFILNKIELNSVFNSKPDNLKEYELPNYFSKNSDWKLFVNLNDEKYIGCDLIIEATGVVPNTKIWKRDCPELELAEDNGILIDEHMKTNIPNVFAAGDVCTPKWTEERSHWKHIRLWTQARQMGIYCARAILIDNLLPDIAFDIFSHVTEFFGYKVVLLGDFSAEKLEKPFEINYRITENVEYIKVITKNHRIQGAVLIGETEMEEVMENLILDQIDISQIEDKLLDPNIDLEDYFD